MQLYIYPATYTMRTYGEKAEQQIWERAKDNVVVICKCMRLGQKVIYFLPYTCIHDMYLRYPFD